MTAIGPNYFGCSRHRERSTCTNGRRIGKDLIEGQVLKQLAKHVLNPEALKAAAEDYRKGAAEANRVAGKRIADLRRACPKRGGEVRVDLTGRLRDLLEVA